VGHVGKIEFRPHIRSAFDEPHVISAERQNVKSAASSEERKQRADFEAVRDGDEILEADGKPKILKKAASEKNRETIRPAPEALSLDQLAGGSQDFPYLNRPET